MKEENKLTNNIKYNKINQTFVFITKNKLISNKMINIGKKGFKNVILFNKYNCISHFT